MSFDSGYAFKLRAHKRHLKMGLRIDRHIVTMALVLDNEPIAGIARRNSVMQFEGYRNISPQKARSISDLLQSFSLS